MIRNYLFIISFIFFYSCSNLEYVYKDKTDLINPLYNNVSLNIISSDIIEIDRYTKSYFGFSNVPLYNLSITVNEKKTKEIVETNQSISKLRYDLNFEYKLNKIKGGCLVFLKDLSSDFSYTPKSSGYNFGSDSSLKKEYKLAIIRNFNEFVNLLPKENELICKNES